MLRGAQLYHYGASLQSLPDMAVHETVDLATVLSSSASSWRTQTKLALATLLSYSFTYLNSGSWLFDGWRQSNIIFYRSGSTIPLRPFLRRQQSPSSRRNSQRIEVSEFHQYPDLLEFGITLLEIFIGKRIEQYKIPCSDRWIIASKVLQMEKAKIPFDDYRDAVNICFLQDGGVGPNCEPVMLRKQLFDNVYRKIGKLLKQGFPELFATASFDSQAAKIDLGSGELRAMNSVDVAPIQELPAQSRVRFAAREPPIKASDGFYLFADEQSYQEPSQKK